MYALLFFKKLDKMVVAKCVDRLLKVLHACFPVDCVFVMFACLQELLKPSSKSYVVHFLGMEQVPKSEGVDAVRGPIRVRSVHV